MLLETEMLKGDHIRLAPTTLARLVHCLGQLLGYRSPGISSFSLSAASSDCCSVLLILRTISRFSRSSLHVFQFPKCVVKMAITRFWCAVNSTTVLNLNSASSRLFLGLLISSSRFSSSSLDRVLRDLLPYSNMSLPSSTTSSLALS